MLIADFFLPRKWIHSLSKNSLAHIFVSGVIVLINAKRGSFRSPNLFQRFCPFAFARNSFTGFLASMGLTCLTACTVAL
jgi:hypothetical protein